MRRKGIVKTSIGVVIILGLCVLALLTACATTDSGTELSLREAIEQSAERIVADIPPGTRIAVTAFESENSNLSDYIMEELSIALINRGMEVVERRSLEYVYRELNFQMSGNVSDESAKSVGKFLGAQMVLTGQLRHLGATYRFTANAIRVEEATRASATRFEVRNDRALRTMIATLNRQPATARSEPAGASGGRVPQTAGAFLDRGIILASQGEWELAILDFTDALNLNPNLSAAYLLRGRAEYASASDIIDIAENFEGVTTILQKGRQLSREQTQAYDRAIADFTKAIRLDINSVTAYLGRGRAYSYKGDVDNAIIDINQAIRLDPSNAIAYNLRGSTYSEKGDFDRAIADFTQAIRLDPNSASAYYNRGITYLEKEKEDFDRAIVDFTQAIRLDQNFASAYYNRGIMYVQKEDFDRAIADFTQAIRLDPNFARAYNNRGVTYTRRGNKNFEESFSKGSRGDRDLQLRAKGDYDLAIADYTQAIRLDSTLLNAYIGRAEANYFIYHSWRIQVENRRRYLDQAFDDLRKALEIDPNNATVKNYLNTWGS